MTKTTRIVLTVTLSVFALALAGAAIGLVVAETDEPAAATGSTNPNAIECANIERAYNSWAIGRPGDMYAYEAASEVDLRTEVADQQELLEAVSGYPDQASKDLALAVAAFGSELAVLNAEMTLTGNTSLDQASVVADAQKKLRAKYGAWKATTCV